MVRQARQNYVYSISTKGGRLRPPIGFGSLRILPWLRPCNISAQKIIDGPHSLYLFPLLTLASRHTEGRVSKRSTSSERRPLTPTPSLKRKRRSSVSPPRKRRTSPPPTSSTKSKTSYTAVPSRSGSQGKGGDRDLRESHPRYLLSVWISVSCWMSWIFDRELDPISSVPWNVINHTACLNRK